MAINPNPPRYPVCSACGGLVGGVHEDGCTWVAEQRKVVTLADRLPYFDEPRYSRGPAIFDGPGDGKLEVEHHPQEVRFKGLGETYGFPVEPNEQPDCACRPGPNGTTLWCCYHVPPDVADQPDCGCLPAKQNARLRHAIETSIKNLEATELHLFPTVAHVIRSLKDALDG